MPFSGGWSSEDLGGSIDLETKKKENSDVHCSPFSGIAINVIS